MTIRWIVAAGILVAATSTAAEAQQSAPQPQSAAASSAAGAVPVASQIKVVNTRRFQAEVFELSAQWEVLNNKYGPARDQMKKMQEDITRLENELSTQGPTLTKQAREMKLSQIDQLKRDFKRQGEDNEAAWAEDQKTIVGPVFEKIGHFLESYAPQHGISVVLDIGNSLDNGVLVYAAKDADITTDLIAEYNRLYPVAAQPATQPGQTPSRPVTPPRPTGLGPAKPAPTPAKPATGPKKP